MDTHILVWIPETIKGKPVTIDNFGELLIKLPYSPKAYQYIDNGIVRQEGSNPIKSGWVLMTTDVISGSRNKSFADQELWVESLNKNGQTGYRVLKIAEAIVCIVAEYLRSKESTKRLFSNDPFTYTRCQENVEGYQVGVGGFARCGLLVRTCSFDEVSPGVAGLRDL